MIKHILMFRLKDEVDGNSKQANAEKAKELLEGINGKIPGLIKIEVGIDFSNTDASADLMLYSEFESREALEVYAGHPEHKAVIPFIKSIVSEKRVVDYEV